MGQGQEFLVRECFPLFLRCTKPIDFFSCVEWGAEEYLVSASAAWSWHLDQGQGCPVPSGGALSPGEPDTTSGQFLSKPVSPKCLSHMHIICHICTVSVLHCVSYSFGHLIYCLMILTFASSSATTNARVENQTLPSHEPSAQAERLFLRKHGSGSQRGKLAFRSKYNPSLETSGSAENWTAHLLSLSLLFCRYFSVLIFNQNIIILLLFHCKFAQTGPRWWCDVSKLSKWAKPHTDVASHPV